MGGIEVKLIGVRAPNQNAVAERIVQSVRRECLDHFVVFGESHLRHLYVRILVPLSRTSTASRIGHWPPGWIALPSTEADRPVAEFVCEERLGGLLQHYRRAG
jgi:putative transposase